MTHPAPTDTAAACLPSLRSPLPLHAPGVHWLYFCVPDSHCPSPCPLTVSPQAPPPSLTPQAPPFSSLFFLLRPVPPSWAAMSHRLYHFFPPTLNTSHSRSSTSACLPIPHLPSRHHGQPSVSFGCSFCSYPFLLPGPPCHTGSTTPSHRLSPPLTHALPLCCSPPSSSSLSSSWPTLRIVFHSCL